jgi:hypothetical protein
MFWLSKNDVANDMVQVAYEGLNSDYFGCSLHANQIMSLFNFTKTIKNKKCSVLPLKVNEEITALKNLMR